MVSELQIVGLSLSPYAPPISFSITRICCCCSHYARKELEESSHGGHEETDLNHQHTSDLGASDPSSRKPNLTLDEGSVAKHDRHVPVLVCGDSDPCGNMGKQRAQQDGVGVITGFHGAASSAIRSTTRWEDIVSDDKEDYLPDLAPSSSSTSELAISRPLGAAQCFFFRSRSFSNKKKQQQQPLRSSKLVSILLLVFARSPLFCDGFSGVALHLFCHSRHLLVDPSH